MKNQQSGFTLIELIVVIVILGILAAVAVPRFVDLSDEAEAATLQATAGAMGSAMAMNYAACLLNSTGDDCQTVGQCDDVSKLMQSNIDGYKVTTTTIASGESVECLVGNGDAAPTKAADGASFTGFGTKKMSDDPDA